MCGERFPKYVDSELRKVGWFPGRRVGDPVEQWILELEQEGLECFPTAREALQEFGGLVWRHDKLDGRSSFNFIPEGGGLKL